MRSVLRGLPTSLAIGAGAVIIDLADAALGWPASRRCRGSPPVRLALGLAGAAVPLAAVGIGSFAWFAVLPGAVALVRRRPQAAGGRAPFMIAADFRCSAARNPP